MSYYDRYPRYQSVGERKAKAQKKLEQYRKKHPDIRPITVAGNKIVITWWGKAWITNLERYADYSNRIGRGRSYVRNGFVIDLQIRPGVITALVQGTRAQPYRIAITIRPLAAKTWDTIKQKCAGKIETLQELIEGKFPADLMELFTLKGGGLFPAPKEISFDCSCPDWASMCKHVAAALYATGVRLDEDPSLFFTLRKLEMHELVKEAIRDTSGAMLQKAETRSSRVIDDGLVEAIFGMADGQEIDFHPQPGPVSPGKGPAPRKSARRKTAPRAKSGTSSGRKKK